MDSVLEKTANALQKRGFDAYTVKTAEEASMLIASWIPKNESITWGGSATLSEIGLKDTLKQNGFLVFDREDVPREARGEFAKEHFFSDWFLMSSNAITEDGELLNLDGIGNRVASLVFGPKNVVVLAGKNKIVPDYESAYTRVREVASPKNAQRFVINTPCKLTGKCADCFSPDTICCSMVRTRFCRPKGRIRVVLIDGTFGY